MADLIEGESYSHPLLSELPLGATVRVRLMLLDRIAAALQLDANCYRRLGRSLGGGRTLAGTW